MAIVAFGLFSGGATGRSSLGSLTEGADMSLSQVSANANTRTNINRNINTHKCKYKYKYNYWYKPNHKIAERHDWRNVLPSSYWRRWGEVKLRPKVSTFSNIPFSKLHFQYSISNISFPIFLLQILVDQYLQQSSELLASPPCLRAIISKLRRCGTRCTRSSR